MLKKRLYICVALVALFASFFAMGSGISSVSAAERTSEAYTIETDALTGGSLTGESESYKIESSTAGESAQTGSMESDSFKVYGQFQETLGSTPFKATALQQYRTDEATVVATGEWVSGDTVVFKFTINDPDPSDFLMAQVEVKAAGTPFTNVPNKSSNEIPFTGSDITAVVTFDSLSEGAYHWQARVIDSEFRASSWESFGGNEETERDFGVSNAGPTVTVETPNGYEGYIAGGTATISWNATAPSGITSVNIYYSSGESYPWVTIATNETNNGTYAWDVPTITSNTMRISIEAVSGNTLNSFDISNNYFLVGPVDTYVSNTGSDETGNGSAAAPFKTIQKALDWCPSNGRVKVFGGTYIGAGNRGLLWPKRSSITLAPSSETSICTIDAEGADRIISAEASVQLTIEAMTMKNARAGAPANTIYAPSGSRIDIVNAYFLNNVTYNTDGGIVFSGGYCYATNTTFKNSSGTTGGSNTTFKGGTFEATNCVFDGCSAGGGNFGLGSATTIRMTNCFIKGTYGNWNGGMSGSNVYLDRCTFEANQASYNGAVGTGGNWYVEDSLFVNNWTNSGASCWLNSNITATNCAFVANTNNAAAAVLSGGTAKFYNCTFANNDSNTIGDVAYNANITAVNSIFWGADDPFSSCTGTLKYCVVQNADWSGFTTTECSSSDPILINPLGRDFRLCETSSALNTGTSEGAPATDMLGTARPQPNDGTSFDMGCMEQATGVPLLPIVWVATDGSDVTGDGSQGSPLKTVQKGLSMVSAEGLVSVESGTYYENEIGWPARNNVKLKGGSADSTVINANSLGRTIVVPTVSLTIETITIRNGFGAGGSRTGGNISLPRGANLTLNRVIIRDGGSYTGGGGVYAVGSTVTAMNSLFMNNVGHQYGAGGAIYGGTWEVSHCNFHNNGGYQSSYASDATIRAVNSIFYSDNWYGAGPRNLTNSTIRNCILSTNFFSAYVSTTESIIANPQFVNLGTDFHLLPTSPAIDTGSTEGMPNDDMDGNVRPHGLGYDIGMYESQGPSVRVEYPNGGEMLVPGMTYNLMFTVSPDASDIYVRLSTNGGTSWPTLLTHEAWSHSGLCTYEWTVPSTAAPNCKISVEAYANNIWRSDASDANFEITMGLPEVYVSPEGSDETGDGSYANPLRTIQKGLNVVSPEGFVYLIPGVHTLATSEFVNNSMANWPNKNGITLKLSPEATETATIDAMQRGRIFRINNVLNISIEGISMVNGGYVVDIGGAVYMTLSSDGSNIWFKNVYGAGNLAAGGQARGGFICPDYTNPDATPASNTKIYIDNCTFESTGSNNWAGFGGFGIFNINNTTFKGGGSYQGGLFTGGIININNSKIIDVDASYGLFSVGIPNRALVNIKNTVFQGNRCYYNVINSTTVMTLESCTFYDNYVKDGVGTQYLFSGGTSDIKNCIFWGRSSPAIMFSGSSYNIRYSDISPSYFVPGTGNISVEPSFASTTEGNANFFRLKPGSLVINMGTLESTTPSLDAAGYPRPHNTYADMGAYEFQGPTVSVIYPNGSEEFTAGGNALITWEASDDHGIQASSINIYLSANNGSTWTTVATGLENDGTYEWTLPQIMSTQCLISIEATNASSEPVWNYDTSNATFSIFGAEVYVSPNGSDSTGNGSAANPFKTVQKGLDVVLAGGKVYMMSGVFTLEAGQFVNNSMVNWPNKNGITLKLSPEATEAATIDAMSNGRFMMSTYPVNITIEGITITKGKINSWGTAIYFSETAENARVWLKNVIVSENREAVTDSIVGAVTVNPACTNLIIYADNCLFKANGGSATNYGKWVATDCTFDGNFSYGGGVVFGNSSTVWNADKCIFYNNWGNYSGIVKGNTTFSVTFNVSNSIFANNGAYNCGIAQHTNVTATNCAFYNSYATNYGSIYGESNWTSVNSIYWPLNETSMSGGTTNIRYSDLNPNGFVVGTGNISIEPKFISTTYGNAAFLHLSPGSPCIDAATMEPGVPSVDLAGNARPRGLAADMGAYEFQGPSIRVLAPNGGETYSYDDNITITWISTDDVSPIRTTPVPINIMYSTNGGASWILLTNEVNGGIFTWEAPGFNADSCLISIETFNELGESNYDVSDSVFYIYKLYPPTALDADALPADDPDHVSLDWTASTSEGITGYNIYRGLAPGDYNPSHINISLVTTTEYNDTDVTVGNDYYYVVKAVKGAIESPYSNVGSAPQMKLSRWSTVEAPVAGGYTGGAHDAVPGATIKFTMKYENIGFGPSIAINIIDAIPENTDYKVYSATGEAVGSIAFSNDNGATYNYTLSTLLPVDPLVTNVSWEVNDVYSGGTKYCTFEVVIR